MMSYYNPVGMFTRNPTPSNGQNNYFNPSYPNSPYHHTHQLYPHHHHHQHLLNVNSTPLPNAPLENYAPEGQNYNLYNTGRGSGNYEEWAPHHHPLHHHHVQHPPYFYPSPTHQSSTPNSTPSPNSSTTTTTVRTTSPNSNYSGIQLFKNEFGSMGPQINGGIFKGPLSPDSGMAVSDGVSSSGSPNNTNLTNNLLLQHHHLQLNNGPNNNNEYELQQHHVLSSSTHPSNNSIGSQQSTQQQQHNLVSGTSSSNNSIQRPTQARSPYEWMKKPTYSSNISNTSSSGKTRTKDKYRVVYSDTQRLELEKEFHYSRYITIRRKSELASILGLSERQVKIWFQNRRAKERKSSRKQDDMIKREQAQVATMVHNHMQNVAVLSGMNPGICNQPNPSSLLI